jgi:hypothetical protein
VPKKKTKDVPRVEEPLKKSAYIVMISERWNRKIKDLPEEVQDLFELLVDDLREKGAHRTEWPNYRPFANNYYHCHLNRN